MREADSHPGDDALRHTLGQNAAEYAQNYVWGKIACQIVGVYEELVRKEAVAGAAHRIN